eukprot:6626166-Karenia_brevis.AAC.1
MTLLQKVKFEPTSMSEPGHTWIEILLFSLAFSPDPRATAMARTAVATRCIAHLTNSFKKDVQALLPLIFCADVCKLFTASRASTNRLQAYGIMNRWTHTRIMFALHPDMVPLINGALASMSTVLTKKQELQLKEEQLYVKCQRLSGKGTFKWRPALLKMKTAFSALHREVIARPVTPYDNLSCSECASFCCPHGHGRQATQPLFSVLKPSKAVWCSICSRSYGGQKWTCPCSKIWSNCPVHFNKLPVLVAKRR